ncbi:MAG: type I-B CRISPR-associated protein Cas7/Cst2/DevR [Armatimonadetes bacterium]|nr:type I-B CRISPR-associated protein Cas7/Cst2/DevR [Armatimonadota bacterium]
MSHPVVTAAILIEASGAALNNAGQAEGSRTDNAVGVKQIRIGRNRYPYVSGQAWRRWWREVLYEDFAWKPSPVTRESKSAYTDGNPLEYEDDDLFGYMAAKKGGATQRRVSPVKNSLLVSVLPNIIDRDFGHFSRNLPVDQPDMVPFEHEHYTTLLQGTFIIGLNQVGRFECGPMRDLAKESGGEDFKISGPDPKAPDVIGLSRDKRIKRVQDTLKALARLRHGANLTRNLSDVSPVVLILGLLDGGNAPFQNLFHASDGERVGLNLERFASVLTDYSDRLLPVQNAPALYIGIRPGVLANEDAISQRLNYSPETGSGEIAGVPLYLGSPGQAIDKATSAISQAEIITDIVG